MKLKYQVIPLAIFLSVASSAASLSSIKHEIKTEELKPANQKSQRKGVFVGTTIPLKENVKIGDRKVVKSIFEKEIGQYELANPFLGLSLQDDKYKGGNELSYGLRSGFVLKALDTVRLRLGAEVLKGKAKSGDFSIFKSMNYNYFAGIEFVVFEKLAIRPELYIETKKAKSLISDEKMTQKSRAIRLIIGGTF